MLQLLQFISGAMNCCRWVSLYFLIQCHKPQFVSGKCTAASGIFLFFNQHGNWVVSCHVIFWMTTICQKIIKIMSFDALCICDMDAAAAAICFQWCMMGNSYF